MFVQLYNVRYPLHFFFTLNHIIYLLQLQCWGLSATLKLCNVSFIYFSSFFVCYLLILFTYLFIYIFIIRFYSPISFISAECLHYTLSLHILFISSSFMHHVQYDEIVLFHIYLPECLDHTFPCLSAPLYLVCTGKTFILATDIYLVNHYATH